MLYLCPNCLNDKIVNELEISGVEVVNLPDESWSFMDIRNYLYSLLNDGVALISCDCLRDIDSNLRKVVQKITNLPSQAIENKRWNVFVMISADQNTNKLLDTNKVVEVVRYSNANDVVKQIRSRVGDGKGSITEASVKKEVLEQLKDIKSDLHDIKDQSVQHHEEVKEDLEQLKTQNEVISELLSV